MNKELWTKVDAYVGEHLIPPEPMLDACIRSSDAAGMPSIHVSAAQGKLLHLLARSCGARRILEIGTLAGYSTIWLARALPANGKLMTLEVNLLHADVARNNVNSAGLSSVVEVRVGPALESLPLLASEPPFDFVFIDADKFSCANYFQWAVRLTRVGAAIVVDNVVREGALIDPSSADANVQGVRRLHEVVGQESRVAATTIQTVGCKGYDGFTYAVRMPD